jgi:hypothetical protein
MLDPTSLSLARERIAVRREERLANLLDEITRTKNAMQVQGLGRSEAVVEKIAQVLAREAKHRVSTAWEQVRAVLGSRGVSSAPSLADELKAELAGHSDVADLVDLFRKDATLIGFGNRALESERSIETACDLALRWVNTEIDLYAASLASMPAAAISQAVHNYYGPVAVLSGPGAVANVSQVIGAEDRQALVAAVDALTQVVRRLTEEELGQQPADVEELLRGLREQAERERPNRLSLASAATGLATVVQTVGALKPAYEAVRSALAPFGIDLPPAP